METELHWPEMKASEDLDFHCTSIFNHRLFLHEPFHQLHITARLVNNADISVTTRDHNNTKNEDAPVQLKLRK